ncbi:MAG: nuclear transport factor 2 family protein [Steroidobacteraceae bacterium]
MAGVEGADHSRIRRMLAGAAGIVMAAFGTSTTAASLEQRLAALERRVEHLDDRAAIEKLTRAYGYYVDKQLWPEVVDCFAGDAVIEIAGRGVYRGREGVDRLFRQAMGGGRVGLAQGALFNHMILQGIVDVEPSGLAAKGRWRASVQIGQYGAFGLWSEGTYENDYVKRDGRWQIQNMHFYATFYAPYDTGWAVRSLPNNGPSKTAPPDAPPSVQYDVYPGHYVPPFHYPNPVTGKPWTEQESRRYSTSGLSPPPAGPPAQPGSPPPQPDKPPPPGQPDSPPAPQAPRP